MNVIGHSFLMEVPKTTLSVPAISVHLHIENPTRVCFATIAVVEAGCVTRSRLIRLDLRGLLRYDQHTICLWLPHRHVWQASDA